MPARVVKTKRDEELWEKAKRIAKKQYGISSGERFYKIVMGIFKKMKGVELVNPRKLLRKKK